MEIGMAHLFQQDWKEGQMIVKAVQFIVNIVFLYDDMHTVCGEQLEDYAFLNPKCKVAMYSRYLIAFVVLALISFICIWLAKEWIGEQYEMLQLILIALLASLLIYFVIAPQIFHRRYKYQITSEKIDVRKGVIIISRTMVPIERIHQVEVTRGPISNALGLANVEITTAGGRTDIVYLDIPVADKIADELNEYINSIIRKGRKNEQ